MKELSITELKQLQLEMLIKVDHFCKKTGIEYFLDFGSAIGAVRHGGYIPWDDDIDIGLTRPNYERFINSFNGFDKNLQLYAPELDTNHYLPFAIVCDKRTILDEGANGHRGMEIGVKIDVFPIDGTSSCSIISVLRHRFMRVIGNIMSRKRRILDIVWKTDKIKFCTCLFVRTLTCFMSYSNMQRLVRRIALRYPFEKSEYACNIVNPAYKHTPRCPRQVFEKFTDIMFEGHNVRILENYDDYLRAIYGDYMQLPPEEQRVPHHGFTAYWKD